MKKKFFLLLNSISMISASILLISAVSMSCSNRTNDDVSVIEKPTLPIQPETPPLERVEYYFSNDEELINKINSLYNEKLKSELIELVKIDILSSGILPSLGINDINQCNIILPVSLTMSNVQFEVNDNIYKLKLLTNLNIQVSSKIDNQSLQLSLDLFDEKWELYFIKQ